jgi:hypothetical protein
MAVALLGWLVLALLTALAATTAVAIALRTAPSSRAELVMVAMTALYALLAAPVLVLGYAGHLGPTALAAGSAATSAATFAALAHGRDPRALLRECGRAALSVLRAPVDGLREAARARSLVLVAVAWAGGLLALAFLLTCLVPYASWDGLMYHEPIIGYAIHNRGFAVVNLPANGQVQSINGYPHLCESVALWFVIFTDKTLVELPNDMGAVGLVWATYALVRRATDRVTAMGWAAVLLLVPATWTQICASYLDVQVGFFVLVATYYATRPRFRVRDAVVATLALALLVESKSSALAWVPPIAVVAYARLFIHHGRTRRLAAVAAVLGGGAALALLEGHLLLRGWVAFHNPLWPIAYKNRSLGIDWPGLVTMQHLAPQPPLKELLDKAYAPPIRGLGDVHDRGYGYAVMWVIVPVAAVAVIALVVTAALELVRLKERTSASNLFWVAALSIVGLRITPNLDAPRYNLHIVAGLMVAVAWLFGRSAWARARTGLLGAAIVLSIMPAFWLDGWGWYWGASQEMAPRLLHPLGSPRAYVDKPYLDLLGRQRYEEVGPGDRVAYDQDIHMPGALWNFNFSNRVEYIPYADRASYLARVKSYDPTWIAVGNGDARKALEGTGEWEVIGQLTAAEDGVALRRKRRR